MDNINNQLNLMNQSRYAELVAETDQYNKKQADECRQWNEAHKDLGYRIPILRTVAEMYKAKGTA